MIVRVLVLQTWIRQICSLLSLLGESLATLVVVWDVSLCCCFFLGLSPALLGSWPSSTPLGGVLPCPWLAWVGAHALDEGGLPVGAGSPFMLMVWVCIGCPWVLFGVGIGVGVGMGGSGGGDKEGCGGWVVLWPCAGSSPRRSQR